MTSRLGQGMIINGHDDPRSLKGVERRREMRAEDAAEVKGLTDYLLAGLGREPIGAEFVAAELVARTFNKIRRLGERGRDDLAERELLQRLMMTTTFGMVPAPPRVPSKSSDLVGPRAAGRDFFVAEKGDDAVPDETTVGVAENAGK